MSSHRVVSREEWITARTALLAIDMPFAARLIHGTRHSALSTDGDGRLAPRP